MRKIVTLLIVFGFHAPLFSQRISQNTPAYADPGSYTGTVSKPLKKPAGGHSGKTAQALTITPVNIGTAGNMFTAIGANRQRITVNQELNTILFTHRLSNLNTAGFDISTDGGTSWDLNKGPVIPEMPAEPHIRYPQGVIFNPVGNMNPIMANLVLMGARATGSNPNYEGWGGLVVAKSKLNASSSAYSTGFNTGNAAVPISLANGSNGVFWAADIIDTNANQLLYKGVWNTTGDSVDWSVHHAFALPFDIRSDGGGHFAQTSINVAFDKTGQYGWYAILADLDMDNVDPFVLVPVFYRSMDYGDTWTGPIAVDLSGFDAITKKLPGVIPGAGMDAGLGVDLYGNPHYVTVVADMPDYDIPSNVRKLVCDVTFDGTAWNAIVLDTVSSYRASIATTTDGNGVTEDNNCQVTVSSDGTKVFASWLDTNPDAQPAPESNKFPDLLLKGIDVVNKKATQTYNLTANTDVESQAYLSSVSRIGLMNGSKTTVPAVIVLHNGVGENPVNFVYLKGAEIDNADFNLDTYSAFTEAGSFIISQNYPNPFTGKTAIRLDLYEAAETSVTVCNLLGQSLINISAGKLAPGVHTLTIDASDLNPGVYLYKVKIDDRETTGRMIIN